MGALRFDGVNDVGTKAYNALFEPAQMTLGALIRIPTGAANADFQRLIDFHTGATSLGYCINFAGSGSTVRPFLYQGFTGIGSEFTFANDVWFWVFLLSNTTGPANSFWTGTLGGTVTQSGASETSTTRGTGGASVFKWGGEAAGNFAQYDLARLFIANVIMTEQELNSICYGASPRNILQARGALNVYYDFRPNFSGQPDLAGELEIAHGGATWIEGPSQLLEPYDAFPLVLPYSATLPGHPIRVHPVGIGKQPPGQLKRYARMRFLTSSGEHFHQFRDDFILPRSVAGGGGGVTPPGSSRTRNLPLTGAG